MGDPPSPVACGHESPSVYAVFGFGQDRHRDLYVLGNSSGVRSGETAVVLRTEEPDED